MNPLSDIQKQPLQILPFRMIDIHGMVCKTMYSSSILLGTSDYSAGSLHSMTFPAFLFTV